MPRTQARRRTLRRQRARRAAALPRPRWQRHRQPRRRRAATPRLGGGKRSPPLGRFSSRPSPSSRRPVQPKPRPRRRTLGGDTRKAGTSKTPRSIAREGLAAGRQTRSRAWRRRPVLRRRFFLKYAVEQGCSPRSCAWPRRRWRHRPHGPGWRLLERRRGYALALEGGGIGIVYLTVFARSTRRLLRARARPDVVLVALASALAVLQDARGSQCSRGRRFWPRF